MNEQIYFIYGYTRQRITSLARTPTPQRIWSQSQQLLSLFPIGLHLRSPLPHHQILPLKIIQSGPQPSQNIPQPRQHLPSGLHSPHPQNILRRISTIRYAVKSKMHVIQQKCENREHQKHAKTEPKQ